MFTNWCVSLANFFSRKFFGLICGAFDGVMEHSDGVIFVESAKLGCIIGMC